MQRQVPARGGPRQSRLGTGDTISIVLPPPAAPAETKAPAPARTRGCPRAPLVGPQGAGRRPPHPTAPDGKGVCAARAQASRGKGVLAGWVEDGSEESGRASRGPPGKCPASLSLPAPLEIGTQSRWQIRPHWVATRLRLRPPEVAASPAAEGGRIAASPQVCLAFSDLFSPPAEQAE